MQNEVWESINGLLANSEQKIVRGELWANMANSQHIEQESKDDNKWRCRVAEWVSEWALAISGQVIDD